MNIYIIGPVTGKPNDNGSEFARVQSALKRAGHNARIPHDFIDVCCGWEQSMRASIREMLRERWYSTPGNVAPKYDAIAMLDGWGDSKGARIEHDLACALGIPCRPWREWL